MANGILSLIQPNGSDKFNLRAESIFYFKADTTGTTTPASGCVSANNDSQALYFSHDNIMSIQEGMLIAFESPANWDYNNVIFISNGTKLNTTPLTIVNNNPTPNGHPDFHPGEWFLMVLMGTTFYVINSHIENQVSNSYRAVSANAVKTYVDGLIANRFTYVLSNSAATTPNATKYGTTQGTLAPTANTEYKIYLVSHSHTTGDVYDEWITLKNGSTYSWEKIGNTDMTIDVAGIISDIANHTFTPGGTVSKPTFTGTKATSTAAGGHSHTVTATGDVTSTFKGDKTTLSGTTTGHTHNISVNGITVTSSYTPAGTVSGEFSGTSATTSSVEAHTHTIEANTLTSTGSYQPTGTITEPTFKGGKTTIESTLDEDYKVSEEGSHTHSIPQLTSTGTYQPEGTITSTFTGTDATISSSNTDVITTDEMPVHNHFFDANALTVTSSYQPAGSVSKPNITVTNGDVSKVTSVGTASSYTVSGEVLTLTASTTPSVTPRTVTAELASTPTFSGNSVTITSKNPSIQYVSDGGAHYHKLAAGTVNVVSGTYKPEGSISATFSGNSKSVSVSYSGGTTGSNGAHEHVINADTFKLSASYQPTGTITAPTFKGGVATITVTNQANDTAAAGGHSHTVTATGNLSNLSFSGTSATITSKNSAAITTESNTDTIKISYQPAGTISSEFNGTSATTSTVENHTHDVTASGNVSQPEFTGTPVTLKHTKKA